MATDAPAAEPARVFVSYASQDDAHRIRLEAALKPLVREGLVELWADREILAGERWEKRIASGSSSIDDESLPAVRQAHDLNRWLLREESLRRLGAGTRRTEDPERRAARLTAWRGHAAVAGSCSVPL